MEQYIVSARLSLLGALSRLNALGKNVLTLFVVDDEQRMIGSLTDGDVRRYLVAGGSLEDNITQAMHVNFAYIESGVMDVQQIKNIRQRGIALLPCLDAQKRIVSIYNLRKLHSILPIDAVLMAGGKGERLRPLTETTPKPLLPVGDKAIIDHNVDRLISYGVHNIAVTVNYLREQLEAHFQEPRNGLQITCVREPQYLGTMGSLGLSFI